MAGAFQTSRDIFENPIWQNIVEFRLFFLVYGKAAFTDNVKIGDIHLKRGQWIRSIRNLQKDLEYIENRSVKTYSLSVISRAISKLVEQNRITVKQSELGTLFTVLNYSKYQGFENYKNNIENGDGTEKEQRENGDGTEQEQNRNNNNNANKDNKEKKDNKESIEPISTENICPTCYWLKSNCWLKGDMPFKTDCNDYRKMKPKEGLTNE